MALTMDLKTFVAETLNQIMSGVAEAAVAATDQVQGGSVNPVLSAGREQMVKHGLFSSADGVAQLVQFDVAITATEGTGTKGGIGVGVSVLKLQAGGQSTQESTSSSRVKFFVPITLPSVR